MKNILITLTILTSISFVNAQESRVVRLDEGRENVISSEIIISEFDTDREVAGIDIFGADLVMDTDFDGLSDFFEENVYFTDPNNKSTVGDSKSDITKMLLGYDPLSETPLEVKYEDIRVDSGAIVLPELSINGIYTINGKVLLKGTGLPLSLNTIYIFDLGLVITVPSDVEGNWEYALAKEVADGVYDLHIGVLNTEGSVVAKGESLIFKKEEGEIYLNPTFDVRSVDLFDLFIQYFWWLILSVFIFGIFVVGILIWRNTEVNEGKY